jgi:predicted transcriptional regulator
VSLDVRRAIGWQSKLTPRYGQCYDTKWDWRVVVEARQQMLKAIEELPDDAGVEEALDRLYLLYKVERGLRQADRGELLSQEEVRERMAKGLKTNRFSRR